MVRAALAKIGNFIKRVFARYEAAITKWGDRSLIFSNLQDARFDVSEYTRKELQRKHRYWVENCTIVQRIRNLFIQFSVGVSGLVVIPNSEDEEWNHARQTSLQQWMRRPEITSNLSFGELCVQWSGALFDGGEYFIHKLGIKGRPMIETIECHRIQTPIDQKDQKDIIDGIRYWMTPDGGIGRPRSYFVATTPLQGIPLAGSDKNLTFREVPAEEIIHKFKARRPGQLRGIPEGFSGHNTLHDYEDLKLLEVQCARLAAEIGLVETNPTGEIDTIASRRTRLNVSTSTAAGTIVQKPVGEFYQVTIGGKKIAMKAGDKIENFQINRPTLVQQQYWDLLLTEVCCAYNAPKLLVVPYSLQGTVTRADLDVCANAYRFNFEILADTVREIYEWQTAWAVKFDQTMDGPVPANPLECIIRPPRPPNVDIGYTAQARIELLRAGLITYQDEFAMNQQDWRHQFEQAAEAVYYLKQLAKKFSKDGIEVAPEEIADKLQSGLAASEPDGGEDETQPAEPKEQAA